MSELNLTPKVELPARALSFGATQFRVAYEELLKRRPGILASEMGGELEWLKDARERDFGRWCTEGLPTKRNEKWQYTNVAPIAESAITLPVSNATTLKPVMAGAGFAAEIVFVNGRYSPSLSKRLNESGVSVVVLSELFEECVENGWSSERKAKFASFRKHVESSDADRETVFAAMNTSFMEDGILVHVGRGTKVSGPVLLSFLSDTTAPELTMISPRVFIHLEENSQASFLETFEGQDGQRYFANTVSDIRVDQNARLSYAKVQLESADAFHIGTTRIHQARSSFAETFQFSFGAKLSREDLHISLEGEGAESQLDGLYMVRGRQHVDNHTAVEHLVPNTTSSQVYKGVLDEQSRAVFNGFVRIYKDAQKSNASQLNNNLMMSAKAEVDTKPELEIDADDVKAAHGATIGRIDPEHVFYLQTRSIPRDEAIRLLALGFAQDIAFRIQDPLLCGCLRKLVDDRFAALKIDAKKESLIQG